MTPYNRMLQLKQYRAQAAADQYNAGMQSIASGASNIATAGVMKGGFGKGGGLKTNADLSGLDEFNSISSVAPGN